MYDTRSLAVRASERGQKRTVLTILVASAAFAIASPVYAQSIGVAACDDYLAKIEACIPKMDPAAQSVEKGIVGSMRKAWTGIAQRNEMERSNLEETCKRFMDNLKAKLENCSFP